MGKCIFLSASVPDPNRDAKYFESADATAIRDSVRALVSVVLPRAKLVWGGHPAITPLVRVVAESLGIISGDKVILYQSNFFRKYLPKDNAAFENVIRVPAVRGQREESLLRMRTQMMNDQEYFAGVFIGGMEGVEEEFELFRHHHPSKTALPIASTGAAAQIIFNRNPQEYPDVLQSNYAYASMFRQLLALDDSS